MKTKKPRTAITISMPQDMAEEYDIMARKLAKDKSVLFRDMFLCYKRQRLKEEFHELQTYGTGLAREQGIFTEADVDEK